MLLLLSGCGSAWQEDLVVIENAVFPLPVDIWEDVHGKNTWRIEFECSFEEFARWLVELRGFRETFDLETIDDIAQTKAGIIETLSRKPPGDAYQGMYVGLDWILEDETPPSQLKSHHT